MTALDSVSGGGTSGNSMYRSARHSRSSSRATARADPGAGRSFAYTQCTPGARPITSAGGWARIGRRGKESRNVGRRGASLPSSQEQFISKVPPTPVTTGESPSRATLGRAAADWSEVCCPLRLPASDDGGRRLVCERLRAHKTLRVPTQSRSPGSWARVAQVLGTFSRSIKSDAD